jgi:ATP-binding cassette subfamily F protein 3
MAAISLVGGHHVGARDASGSEQSFGGVAVALLAADSITKRFNDQIIVEDVSFTIQPGNRIGLVGKNGIGKTTLLDLMTGQVRCDTGTITKPKACIIDYVRQDKTEYLEQTLFDFVVSARDDLLSMRREIGIIEERLQTAPNDTDAVAQLGQLQQRFEIEGGFNLEHDIEVILNGLGFPTERFADRMRNFSGGEKNRAGLAHALAGRGHLLLLDEPTNHLDIESTQWLEEYLTSRQRAFLVVSHDRAFLNNVANSIWDMGFGKVEVYPFRFAQFLVQRSERRRLHTHRYKHQQAEIKRIEEFVRRNMAGQKTKQAKSKLKYLGRMKRLAAPRGDSAGSTINVQSSGRSYAHVISVDNVALGYGSEPVASDLAFDIYRGDKIGLIGRNGSGKSTILKALIGELMPISGEVKLGNNVDVAYFDQELSDLNLAVTVLDSLWEMDPMAPAEQIRSALGRFGFTGEDPFKLVSALSGGEKTKLSLARLLYHPANFIIFDEPTNHLDIDSRETLEEALINYDGSCLIVSHDRYFLDRVVDKIMHLEAGRLTAYPGNYSYFAERTGTSEEMPLAGKGKKSKDDYLAFKEQSRLKAHHKKAVQATRKHIADLENELTALSEQLSGGIDANDWEKLDTATKRKAAVEDELLDRYAELEKLTGEQHD